LLGFTTTFPVPKTVTAVKALGKQVKARIEVQFKAQVRRRSRVKAFRVNFQLIFNFRQHAYFERSREATTVAGDKLDLGTRCVVKIHEP